MCFNIDLKSTPEENDYYFILKTFNDDYALLVNALKELALSTLKPSELLKIIEDVRFFNDDVRRRNYDKLKPDIEKLLDLPMDTILMYKQNKSRSLFGDTDEVYTDEFFKDKK